MKLLIFLSCLSLVGVAYGAPAIDTDVEKIIVSKEFFPPNAIKYKSQHDIVKITVPLNSFNFENNDSNSKESDLELSFFFVEADVDSDGKRTYKGLYVFKDNKATKLLDNGRDAAASLDDSTKVFLAAQDGLYVYRPETNEAVKYGTVTDSIIGIAKTDTGDLIYILTEDHEVFKVTNDGTTKTKVDEVVNAQQIVLDLKNNLYFYDEDLQIYVLTADGVKKIEGLPASPKTVTLIKPSFIRDNAVPVIVDNTVYTVFENGTSDVTDLEFDPKAKPTACAMEATLIQYYAFNKEIYVHNIVAAVTDENLKSFTSTFDNKSSTIQALLRHKKLNKHT